MTYSQRKFSIFTCGFAVALFGIAALPAHAQERATTPIVVLDLSKVFDNHPGFQARIEKIKESVKAEEAKIQQLGEQIKARVQQLQTMNPSDPNYKSMEAETATMQARVQADMQLKRKGFLEEEAKAYFETYQEVKAAVKAFAESNRIGIVLRYSSEEIDPANRQSVLQGINQPIVYNQGGLDVTSYIIRDVSRSSGTARATSPPRR